MEALLKILYEQLGNNNIAKFGLVVTRAKWKWHAVGGSVSDMPFSYLVILDLFPLAGTIVDRGLPRSSGWIPKVLSTGHLSVVEL